MRENKTEFVNAMSEAEAREKIKKCYENKKNLSILSCIPKQKDDVGYEITLSYDEPAESKQINDSYVCSVCGKKGVKLWRPYGNVNPLICAVCAEERQSPCEYDEVKWEKEPEGMYKGTPTKRKLPLPKWRVDENGNVPSYRGPGPEDTLLEKTDQLIVDMRDISKSYTSGNTTMLAAIFDDDGECWCYSSVPEDECKWWKELPTR